MLDRRSVLLSAAALAACQQASRGQAQPLLRMSSPRAAHAAVVLADGSVLIMGGCVGSRGCDMGPASAGVERYDPGRGVIEPAGELQTARNGAATALLPDGRVVLAGGWTADGPTDSVEVYDPVRRTSRQVAGLAIARADFATAQLADGRLLLAGGIVGRTAVPTVELFDPRTLRVQRMADLPRPRGVASATPLRDGRVLLAGGTESYSGQAVAPAELFDPSSGKTVDTGGMIHPRWKHAAVGLRDGRVLLVGGSGSGERNAKLSDVEVYEPKTGRFLRAGATLAARFKIADAVVGLPDGRVLIAGGAERPEVFDPQTGRSRFLDVAIGGTLNFSTAVLLRSGDVLLAGGYSERGILVTDRVWIIARSELA